MAVVICSTADAALTTWMAAIRKTGMNCTENGGTKSWSRTATAQPIQTS